MKYIVTLFLVMMQMVSFCQADTAKPYDYAFKAWINTRGDTVKSKIFVCRKGEKRLVLTSGSYPSLSPDGKEVVYTEDDKIDSFYIYHINLIDIHTKKILKLYSGTPRKWLDARPRPIWSPNGNYLAFNSFIDNFHYSQIQFGNHMPINRT